MRRAADKIDVFAQAGQVFEPRVSSDLFALLEPMIHPASAPRPGMLFHPKVWVLEYADGDARSYRMLCASRNLTNDRSWDLIVRLDGIATDDATEQSAPLAEFVRALPAMAVLPLPDLREARIRDLANTVARIEWERPSDVRAVRFHPYGIRGVTPEPLHALFDGVRHGIISPFLSDEGIRRIIPSRSESIVVLARREQLERLDSRTLERIDALILDDAANDDDAAPEGDPQDTESADATTASPKAEPMVGLHAKAYVLDRRSGSHLFVGSANATEAAFGGNVEMLVEFEGPQPKLGVVALLGEQSRLRAMTIPFEPQGDAEIPPDEVADQALEQVLRSLAARRYFAHVVAGEEHPYAPDDGGADERETVYHIRLSADGSTNIPAELNARATLLTRPAKASAVPGEPVVFERLALTDITPFIVLRITDGRGATRSTVVTAALEGDIPGRQDAVIARQLADRSAFMRLLALLLAFDDGDGVLHFDPSGALPAGWAEDGSGLFETLVRAIGVEHGGLADVRRIIEHVRAADGRRPEGAPSVLPDGFNELWKSVWAAYSTRLQAGVR
ncbi:phospholipase D family protein [Mycolicibacterium sphagni]|uniref:phospholipase D family protein n=1 Tax=Mycolicibacterium sphagni TaxID=1786 RepID=UPI0021F3BAC4|nr:phospholipase D family protein [Mycolicibacterium sphagni]